MESNLRRLLTRFAAVKADDSPFTLILSSADDVEDVGVEDVEDVTTGRNAPVLPNGKRASRAG